jgi:hypothetical protein
MAHVQCDWTRTETGEAHHDFGFTDAKGRAIGLVVDMFEVVYVAAPVPSQFSPVKEPGKYYCFVAQQTRNGKPFGASNIFRECRTREQLESVLSATICDAKSRYAQ